MSFSVVIPAYNEGIAIGRVLKELMAYMGQHQLQGRVIVVDDGSTDDTVGAVGPYRSDRRLVYIRKNIHQRNASIALFKLIWSYHNAMLSKEV